MRPAKFPALISGLALVAVISIAGVGYYFRLQRIRQQAPGNISDDESPATSTAWGNFSPTATPPLSGSIKDAGHIEPQRKPTLTQTKDGKEYILRSYDINLRMVIPNDWEVIEGMNGINLAPVNAMYPHIGLSPMTGFPFKPDVNSYIDTKTMEIVSSNLGQIDGHRVLRIRTKPANTGTSTGDEWSIYTIAVDLGKQDSLLVYSYYDERKLAELGVRRDWTIDRFISTVDQIVSTFKFDQP